MFPLKTVGMHAPSSFFQCHLRATGGRQPKKLQYKIGPDDLLFNLLSLFQHVWGAELAHPWTDGGRWSAQTVRAWPNSVPLCGSSWPHGRQSLPVSSPQAHPLVSGWQLDPYNPTQVQQAQGFQGRQSVIKWSVLFGLRLYLYVPVCQCTSMYHCSMPASAVYHELELTKLE